MIDTGSCEPCPRVWQSCDDQQERDKKNCFDSCRGEFLFIFINKYSANGLNVVDFSHKSDINQASHVVMFIVFCIDESYTC